MGNCSGLFYSSNGDQQTLHRRVRPTDDQMNDQKQYWGDLADYLKADLKERSGYPTSHWLQGSYKFGTQVRPADKNGEFDIDLGLYFHWEGTSEDGNFTAPELKEMVQCSLTAYANDDETDATLVTAPKDFCSRIQFSEDFHIDVPAYHDNDTDRKLASKDNGFIESDPRLIYDWWKEQFADENQRDRARRMVRYLKMWAALNFNPKTESPPSSIMITVLVALAYQRFDETNVSGDDETLSEVVCQIVGYFEDSESNEVLNPINENENINRLGDDFDNFHAKLKDLMDCCERATQAESQDNAAEIWTEAFHHFFPLPEGEQIMKAAMNEDRQLVEAFVPEVEIVVTLPNGKTTTLRNAALNIPKMSRLEFTLVNSHAAPRNSIFKWVVRNEGEHAETVNDLGHFSGFGNSVHNETAEYRGKHFMDLSIISNDIVVGRRRVPVSIINNDFRGRRKRLFSSKRR